MNFNILKPRQVLNKAFLKVKPNRNEIEKFKSNLIRLLNQINEKESEEFHKNLVSDFLKKTYYDPDHFINTKGRSDLVIHNGKDSNSTVGVIFETKKPTNKHEMLSQHNINVKAFHEVVLYYLRERLEFKNLEVRHIIITNIFEWFIFDGTLFEKTFAQNKDFVKQFNDFEAGRLAGKTTDFFYKEIAEPAIQEISRDIEFVHFDIRDYKTPLLSENKQDDNKLVALYKLLSPEHLLKLPFANDNNSLDKAFYTELLHIIGLIETKVKSKKLIERNKEGQRNPDSIIENAIIQLDSLDKINRLDNPNHFGDEYQDRLFNVALEVTITWVNRILFLKLLEAQLIKYHTGDTSYFFLNLKRIHNYDDLNTLFFQVLARKNEERSEDVKNSFANVPYLNSSLFEPSELEHKTIFISNLRDEKKLPIHSSTVLKDENGKKRKGSLNALEYLFEFLNAYDFASEGSEEIQEENKSLINASVLGLIFEKINGYKDGSYFTPGFITMYMCRETLRKAVVQKFNEQKGWVCKNFNDLYNNVDDIKEANNIINSLKICDPAVGSGHFLVSALNEIISIKNDLKVLQDRHGWRLKEYQVEVVNDELIVTDEDGELFEYNYKSKESQRIQETLFHEKQTIIENCLFGVDINPNSVKICRLRLWIELLKNAYYKENHELETLPNIDINIKCGNSLISRFDLDSDLKQALKRSKWNIDTYKIAVQSYREAKNKEDKRSMQKLIDSIKSDFRTEISNNDPKVKRLNKLGGELFNILNQQVLFDESDKEKKLRNQKTEKLNTEVNKLNREIEEIKTNKIYENAFEWRFDVMIGNPPYIRIQDLHQYEGIVDFYHANFESAKKGNYDIYILFIEKGIDIIIQSRGLLTYILPNKFITSTYGVGIKSIISQGQYLSQLIHFGHQQVFDDATTYTCLLFLNKKVQNSFLFNKIKSLSQWRENPLEENSVISCEAIKTNEWFLLNSAEHELLFKLKHNSISLEDVTSRIFQGLKTSADKIFIVKEIAEKTRHLIIECQFDYKTYTVEKAIFQPLIKGGHSKKYFFLKSNLFILFPYKDGQLIHQKEFESKYPYTWEYLINHKEYLENRESGKMKTDKWYGYGRTQAIEVITEAKLFTPDISQTPSFSFDSSGSYFFTGGVAGGYGLLPISLNEYYLLGLLNSKVTQWYISRTSTQMRGGWYSFESRFIKSIPIKTPNKLEQNEIIKIVLRIISLKKESPNSNTDLLEKKIDQIVYTLYGLTEEEIKIVEEIS
jgi:hypothetical protein